MDYSEYAILVVDNGSIENEAVSLERIFGAKITVARLPENRGFAAGGNYGIQFAAQRKIPYVLLLNNDCIVAPDLLQRLVDTIESAPKVAVTGPVICYQDRPSVVNSAGSLFRRCMAQSRRLGLNRPVAEMPTDCYEVDFVDGSCMLASTDLVAREMLDTSYFLYWEEVDWCVRLHRNGLRVLCTPSARVWHKASASSGGSASDLYLYAFLRNQLLFLRRNKKPFCDLLRCLSVGHVIAVLLLVGIFRRSHEGPKVLFRLGWLVFRAMEWNARSLSEDHFLQRLVTERAERWVRRS
jgi:GT2 family glycosyltransferase